MLNLLITFKNINIFHKIELNLLCLALGASEENMAYYMLRPDYGWPLEITTVSL